MIKKTSSFILIACLAGAVSFSCNESIPDCPTQMCVVAQGWKLTEVVVDDDTYNGDLSQYKLTLHMPSPSDAVTAAFHRINTSGSSDEGTWSLESNNKVLRLVPDNDQLLAEDWIIESMTPRSMVLIINRDVSIKEGPSKIEFTLEPF